MKRLIVFSFLLLFAAAVTAQEKEDTEKKQNSNTEASQRTNDEKSVEFVKEAASGGMMEVQLGKMAKEKASSQAVKDFGAMMVKDHSKANEELKAIAKKNNIAIPDKLSDKHKKHVDELSKLSGSEFDNEYIDLMMEDHEEDISKFEKASEDLANNDIKDFAKKTLPVLKQHKQKVDQVNKDVKSISRSDNTDDKK